MNMSLHTQEKKSGFDIFTIENVNLYLNTTMWREYEDLLNYGDDALSEQCDNSRGSAPINHQSPTRPSFLNVRKVGASSAVCLCFCQETMRWIERRV